jgi:hypothetical protein
VANDEQACHLFVKTSALLRELLEQRRGAPDLPVLTVKLRDPVIESAGINRHIVGDERALQKRRSDSILASSLACDLARDHSEA